MGALVSASAPVEPPQKLPQKCHTGGHEGLRCSEHLLDPSRRAHRRTGRTRRTGVRQSPNQILRTWLA